MLRSHTLGELNRQHQKLDVTLCGWVDRVRDIGQLFFLTLRDRYGVTQCVFETSHAEHPLMQDLRGLSLEDCVMVMGKVQLRSAKDQKPDQPTGEIEVVIDKLTVLNKCEALPFQVKDDAQASDELRLKYRYLDLRRPKMQRNLLIRHKTIQAARSAFAEMGFLEIETPVLIRSTPEGARDFVVPSRLHPGKFYALPQSPQLYKQMLMISGADRYFQFAQAFRDEDLRADRVPVHTQIDMEMTFVTQDDVFHAVETFVSRVFSEVKGIDLTRSFPRMTYAEAMDRYGCDKPDTRFGLELKSVTELVKETDFAVFQDAPVIRAIAIPEGSRISRKDIDTTLLEKAKIYGAKGLAWTRVKDGTFSGGVAKYLESVSSQLMSLMGATEDTLILFVADKWNVACAALNQVRLEIGRQLNLMPEGQYNFLWVTDFPLFEFDEDSQSWQAMHHLFTMPRPDHVELLDRDPGQVLGQLYDLVLNGVELLSGSIRINRPEIQQKVLDIVKMPKEEADSKFGFLMEAFSYGAPPHGGSAMGLDRLVAILAGEEAIREVIAYPCNNTGVFPLDGSPAPLNPVQLKELGINVMGASR